MTKEQLIKEIILLLEQLNEEQLEMVYRLVWRWAHKKSEKAGL